MSALPKIIIISGAVLAGIGLLVYLAQRANIPLGRLPGDIYIRKNHTTFYFPLTTCVLLSLVLSVIGYFLFRK
ncbi:MAG: DUF2905 family protein [Candidatus Omnitrophica bacterium]|nr:DUF2905 family protein [Candidatus Omnitrophota bacterium]